MNRARAAHLHRTGVGCNDGWNVLLGVADDFTFALHEVGIFDDLLVFDGQCPSREKCSELAADYASIMSPRTTCEQIEFRYIYHKELKFDDFSVSMPCVSTVSYDIRNDLYSINGELQDYPPKGKLCEFHAIPIPKGHVKTIQEFAGQKGETIDNFIINAILKSMGLADWPEIDTLQNKL